ncbi:Gldg family protein [Oscillospiraceae bacterium PP1C4]
MKKLFNRKNGVKSIYAVMTVLAIVIVVLINVVSTALVDRYPLKIDLTQNSLFELDKTTLEYIKGLDSEVSIQVLATEERFVSTSTYNAQANEIMRQFAKNSPKVTVKYINYVKDPTFAANYPDLSIKHGDVIVSANGRDRLVKTEELFNYSPTQSGGLTITSSKAEQAISSAIMNVVSADMPRVSVVTGHDETTMTSFSALLTDNNFEVASCQLATEPLTAETDVLLLIAPKNDFSTEELEKLDAFLYNDGHYGKTLFYCGDAEQTSLPNLETFLAEWGVKVNDGAVFETNENRVYNYHPFYAIADYVNADYATMLRSAAVPMLMPISRPLEVAFAYKDNYSTDVLLQFGESIGVRPSNAGEDFTADDATVRGPIPALVLCSYQVRDSANANTVAGQSNVLISGSAGMLDKYAVGNSAFSNAEYLINLLNDLCQRNDVISVTPKTIAGSPLNITQQTADYLGSLFVFIIPSIVLALGVAVWMMRRHK